MVKCGEAPREGACENLVTLSMYDGPMETFKDMWVSVWCMLDWIVGIVTKLQKYTSLAYSCWTSESTKWDAVMGGGDELCENSNPLQG